MANSTISLLPSGTLIAERFAVQGALGRGGMATVYEAHDLRLRQRVAVKVLAPAFAADPGAVERFLREARAVVALRNRHVVRVLDAGTLPYGAPYLVMEFLDGQNLGAVLASEGPLPFPNVVEYALQALEALAEAHRSGIVHRDLKPDNLMLVRGEDGLSLVKIIDFGISKLIGPEFTLKNLTLDSSFLGSPLYASPEQLRDTGKVDARTDIWSLGVVMYELLTGRAPFDGRSPAALMAAINTATPLRVDDLRGDVPKELANAVMRCLEKDVERRYPSAQDLAVALCAFAPNARSRLSVEHIIRVQSSAPPPPPPPPPPPTPARAAAFAEAPTSPSLPPAWSTVTTAPAQPSRAAFGRNAVLVLTALAACGGVVAALALRTQVAKPDGSAASSPSGVALAAPAVAPPPVAESQSSRAVAPPATSASSAPQRAPVSGVRARAITTATPSSAPSVSAESSAPRAVPNTPRAVRSLDPQNPFKP